METNQLNAIVEQLQEEKVRIEEAKAELKEKLKATEEELKGVEGALSALGVKPTGKGSGKKKAATKSEVIQLVEALLKDHGVVEEASLKTLVEQQLKEAGKSFMGLSLRFKEALKDSRFVDSPSGYRLADETEGVGPLPDEEKQTVQQVVGK